MFRVVKPMLINYTLKTTKRCKNTNAKRISKRNLTVNPGVNLQMRILSNNELGDAQNIDLEKIETDFSNLEVSHKKIIEESETIKEREQYLMVREKYFRDKYPNFLMWNDKLQIRYLHNIDPEEWCVEKLSNGFPALPEVIKKIIKSSWSKTNLNKIKNHDLSVEKNWKLFKEGKLDIPFELKEHLNNFTSRKLNHFIPNTKEKKQALTRAQGEFSEILHSYDRLKNNKDIDLDNKKWENIRVLSDNLKDGKEKRETTKEDTKLVTLDEFKCKTGKVCEMSINLCEEDDMWLIKDMDIHSRKSEKQIGTIIDISELKSTNHLQTIIKPKKVFKHLEYPEKIIIPEDQLKKGYTYKLNDCFYDCDGLFLYRVPGMEN